VAAILEGSKLDGESELYVFLCVYVCVMLLFVHLYYLDLILHACVVIRLCIFPCMVVLSLQL
jgi:hypothetical protein